MGLHSKALQVVQDPRPSPVKKKRRRQDEEQIIMSSDSDVIEDDVNVTSKHPVMPKAKEGAFDGKEYFSRRSHMLSKRKKKIEAKRTMKEQEDEVENLYA